MSSVPSINKTLYSSFYIKASKIKIKNTQLKNNNKFKNPFRDNFDDNYKLNKVYKIPKLFEKTIKKNGESELRKKENNNNIKINRKIKIKKFKPTKNNCKEQHNNFSTFNNNSDLLNDMKLKKHDEKNILLKTKAIEKKNFINDEQIINGSKNPTKANIPKNDLNSFRMKFNEIIKLWLIELNQELEKIIKENFEKIEIGLSNTRARYINSHFEKEKHYNLYKQR